ncbi:MAG TPA: hypothetical protein VMG82_40055 [Candidatus Sulfotelmatobacter sp.]|nr:hypothetical protein [Candidatus Sulfotelmatobacter sp.]
MRILVLDGDQNQAVACVRSLARQGHSVFVGESHPWSKAGWSRYASGVFQYPSPARSAAGFVAELIVEVAKEPGTLVLPMTEVTTLPVSKHRKQFMAAGARLVLPGHDDLMHAIDKKYTTRLARSLGLTVPKTCSVSDGDELNDRSRSMSFPLVLKPRTSQEHSADDALQMTGRPKYARNADELAARFSEMRRRCSSVLVQEFVEGTGSGYFALMDHGELRAEFAHRRIRDVHPTGSGSALRESILPVPGIREKSLAMLRALNWHGVAMIEYRIRPDNVPVFIEINGRFWHSLALACYAGVDFPGLLSRMVELGDLGSAPDYKPGVKCRWLVGDLRHLIEVWKGPPAGFPGRFPGRLPTLFSELVPKLGTFHDNFMWRDPLPEIGDWIRSLQQAYERNF